MDDAAFKKLFSHPRMIELLIRRHVAEWDGKIEYSTLERLPTELIDERLRRRYPDMMWRARTIDGTTDLVLLLELTEWWSAYRPTLRHRGHWTCRR